MSAENMIAVDTSRATLSFAGQVVPCIIGRSGTVPATEKREGDGATPLGEYGLGSVLLRPGRAEPPPLALPWRWLAPDDGWSDDPRDPAYNRPVRHPHPHSAERLWREDGLYDVIVTTMHNTPPVAGRGSAIFLHCRVPGKDHTEGCVAVEKTALLALLARLPPHAYMKIG